jgi:hypothetical protein
MIIPGYNPVAPIDPVAATVVATTVAVVAAPEVSIPVLVGAGAAAK